MVRWVLTALPALEGGTGLDVIRLTVNPDRLAPRDDWIGDVQSPPFWKVNVHPSSPGGLSSNHQPDYQEESGSKRAGPVRTLPNDSVCLLESILGTCKREPSLRSQALRFHRATISTFREISEGFIFSCRVRQS